MEPVQRKELPKQAQKILQRETEAIRALAQEAKERFMAPADALEAVCAVLNQRGRYSSITGEHFDRQDFEGIQVIDALDEELARALRIVLKTFVDAHKKTPDLKTLERLAGRLRECVQELPRYPVGYMALGSVHAALDGFKKLVDEVEGEDLVALEHSLVHFLLGLVDKYVQTRERPLERHYSDIQREYHVVRRMKCACGEEKFHVLKQGLCFSADGGAFDHLEVQCKACGVQRSMTFDLPHFRDLNQI